MGESISLEEALGQKLLLAFSGKHQPSPDILEAIRRYKPGGITLFRSLNIDRPAQVRQLTAALQRAARVAGLPPLLIAADQEGGQLMAIGAGTTQLPGNMALGATASPELARRAGQVLGRELAAMGINANYAPVCDVNVNPKNPVVGTRSFGEDPQLVAQLSSAMIEGMQMAGVAATAKHFPGHGDTAVDSHYGTPLLLHDRERLRRVELPPFEAAIRAGVRLVMSAHIALPALNDGLDLPSTLSSAVLKELLRSDLGFKGVIVSDSMEMHAIQQGPGLAIDAIAAVRAGVDLLLLGSDPQDQQRVFTGLIQAARRGLISGDEIRLSAERILKLKGWLEKREQPALDVVACSEHQALADEIAEKSVTLVRNTGGILPLRLDQDAELAVVVPRPEDLTPADTSSYVTPSLAAALRQYHPRVSEFIIPLDPGDGDIRALSRKIRDIDLVIFGTINAADHPGQVALAKAFLESETPVVMVALRLPYDLLMYPQAPTYICVYSILEPSMKALAAALWGEIPFTGRLPVSIPNL
jgi:beta-N-acetylhexosaminidase